MSHTIGCFIIDIPGTELTAEDRELLSHPLVGGMIFFTRNYESRAQLNHLSRSIRTVRSTPLLLMTDQEGGRVQRFIKDFTRLPPMASFGEQYDHDPKKACSSAEVSGHLLATEILRSGIDLSLAPVLDLQNAISQVIGDRAFHADPAVVAKLAHAFISGMHRAGMAATGKHFPGHGSIAPDSHIAMPIDHRSYEEIEKSDLQPFMKLIDSGLDALMAAHIVFPKIDPNPVGFSRFWLQDILRNKLQFTGTIFTDDLNMQGANISDNYADRVLLAREAGCDFAMLCNNRQGVIQVLDQINHQKQQVHAEKWRCLQGKFDLTLSQS